MKLHIYLLLLYMKKKLIFARKLLLSTFIVFFTVASSVASQGDETDWDCCWSPQETLRRNVHNARMHELLLSALMLDILKRQAVLSCLLI